MNEINLNRGDLGRRIAHRRGELGLSVQAVAERAQMDPQYLEYLEEAPDPNIGVGVALRLAQALDTTTDVLFGGGLDRPAGRGAPGRDPVLVTMEEVECWQRLEDGGVGRLVFLDVHGRPSALPVNFATVDHQIIVRTAPGSEADHAGDVLSSVGFEVDRIDDPQRTGWSILVRGTLHRLDGPARHELMVAPPVAPWAGGERDSYLRIDADELSGRRIEVFG